MTAEQACLGAAITAGVGAGIYESYEAACRELVHLDAKVYEPIPENQKRYEELYPIFQELYSRNQELFGRLGEISQKGE